MCPTMAVSLFRHNNGGMKSQKAARAKVSLEATMNDRYTAGLTCCAETIPAAATGRARCTTVDSGRSVKHYND